jgi:hypothetical protein
MTTLAALKHAAEKEKERVEAKATGKAPRILKPKPRRRQNVRVVVTSIRGVPVEVDDGIYTYRA